MLAMDSSTVIGGGMPFSSRGLVSCSLAGLSHMASQFNTVGRHRALLAFTLRAGLEAFAMQLGAGIAVVPEQRNGVVNLFCTANGRSHTRQWQMAKRDCCRKSSFFHTASSYSCDSLMAAVGHTSSQRPQKMQRPRLNCRKLARHQIRFHRQRVRRAGVHAGRAADTLLRRMFRFAAKVLSTGIGSSG